MGSNLLVYKNNNELVKILDLDKEITGKNVLRRLTHRLSTEGVLILPISCKNALEIDATLNAFENIWVYYYNGEKQRVSNLYTISSWANNIKKREPRLYNSCTNLGLEGLLYSKYTCSELQQGLLADVVLGYEDNYESIDDLIVGKYAIKFEYTVSRCIEGALEQFGDKEEVIKSIRDSLNSLNNVKLEIRYRHE